MRPPTFTIRRLMVIVLGVAVGLHLSIAAWTAYRYRLPHVHSAIYEMALGPAKGVAVRNRPFWPAFWQRSLGVTWGYQRSCFLGGDALGEMCELNNPEIRMPLGPFTYGAFYTKEQSAIFWKLWNERQNRQEPRSSELTGFLTDPLTRCWLPPAAIRIALGCSSGVEAVLTKVRKSGSPASGEGPAVDRGQRPPATLR